MQRKNDSMRKQSENGGKSRRSKMKLLHSVLLQELGIAECIQAANAKESMKNAEEPGSQDAHRVVYST